MIYQLYMRSMLCSNFSFTDLHYCCLIYEYSLSLSPQLLRLSITPFSTVLHVTVRTLFRTWILLSRNCFRSPSELHAAVELSPFWTSKNSESHLSVLAVVSTFYFHSIGWAPLRSLFRKVLGIRCSWFLVLWYPSMDPFNAGVQRSFTNR